MLAKTKFGYIVQSNVRSKRMLLGRKSVKKQPEDIDTIALRSHDHRRARKQAEIQEQLALAKKLGDRAMDGGELSIPGFMAIGFPLLRPDSAEYAKIVNAYHRAAHIAAGSCVRIGSNAVLGITSGTGKENIAFNVQPCLDHNGNDGYYVTADVLCERALYTHAGPEAATIYGDAEQPYGVSFIDSFNLRDPSPVRVILPHTVNPEGHDTYADNGAPSYTDPYTNRLLSDIATQRA